MLFASMVAVLPTNIACGVNGSMDAKVTWNTNGLHVKGDCHQVLSNLAFDNEQGTSTNAADLLVLGVPDQGRPGDRERALPGG